MEIEKPTTVLDSENSLPVSKSKDAPQGQLDAACALRFADELGRLLGKFLAREVDHAKATNISRTQGQAYEKDE